MNFKRKVLILTHKFVFLIFFLFAKGNGSFPTKFVGLFDCDYENCGPPVAAMLAVHKINSSWNVFHRSIPESSLHNDRHNLGDSIVVTGNPQICEEISRKQLPEINSFLVCYGSPTKETIEKLYSRKNVFLTHPNPKAMIPCIYKMILKIQQTATKRHPVAVSVILDPNHASYQIEKGISDNLDGIESIGISSWSPDNFQFQRQHAKVHVVIAALIDSAVIKMMCEMYKKAKPKENVVVILLGKSGKGWMNLLRHDEDSEEDGSATLGSCTKDQLLSAAEGHFLLQFPNWNPSNKEVRKTMNELSRKNNGIISPDLLLVYDSVWAIAAAINRSIPRESERKMGASEMLRDELQKSFAGVTGNFSLTPDRVRSTSSAVIILEQFDNGEYIEIGRHFNRNMSFNVPLGNVFSFVCNGTCDDYPTYEDDAIGVMVVLVLLLAIFSLLSCTFLYFFKSRAI